MLASMLVSLLVLAAEPALPGRGLPPLSLGGEGKQRDGWQFRLLPEDPRLRAKPPDSRAMPDPLPRFRPFVALGQWRGREFKVGGWSMTPACPGPTCTPSAEAMVGFEFTAKNKKWAFFIGPFVSRYSGIRVGDRDLVGNTFGLMIGFRF